MLGISLTLLLPLTLAPAAVQDAPPGLVLVKGGNTKIGTKVKEAEELILAREAMANAIAGETPQITEKVADFYLMVSEVTNEQYAQFVEATGVKPPYTWGDKDVIDEARAAYLEEQGKKIKEARDAGERPPERVPFDVEAWWEDNWDGKPWKVPEELLDHPVVHVDYAAAQGYARWAGLRLMTEPEFARAARGDSDRTYPWGEDWDDKKFANTLRFADKDGTVPVGTFEDGAVDGIFDLSGNVWEWTQSPYNSFKGYKALTIKAKKRTVKGLAPFDPNLRVLVGGSFNQDESGVRVAVRFGAERTQSTTGVGFRCAADVEPGKTAAEGMIDQGLIKTSVLPEDVDFFTDAVVVKHRWETTSGKAKVPNYAVISNYESLMFCPVTKVAASSKNDMTKASSEAPVMLGFIKLPKPLAEPAMDGGNYLLAWRGAGKLPELEKQGDAPAANMRIGQDAPDAIPFWEVGGFNAEADCFFLYSIDGEPLVAFPAPEINYKAKAGIGKMAYEPFVPPEKVDKDAPPIVPLDTLRMNLLIPGKSKNKALGVELVLKVAEGALTDLLQ